MSQSYRRFNINFVTAKCLSAGFVFKSDDYKSSAIKYPIECIICGFILHKKFVDVLYKNILCTNCENIKKEKQRILLFDRGFELLEKQAKSSTVKQNIKHIKCGYTWLVKPYQIINKCGYCPFCSRKIKHTVKELTEKYFELGFTFLSDSYKDAFTHYKTKCNECFHVWDACVNTILNVGTGCPVCCGLKNEKLTFKYLQEILKNINIDRQIYLDCPVSIRKSGKTKIDLNFIYDNQIYYVEYNGKQHYQPENFFKEKNEAVNLFEYQKQRDEWLRKYCFEHNIILIEIDGRKYKGENIKKFLIKRLKEYKILEQ